MEEGRENSRISSPMNGYGAHRDRLQIDLRRLGRSISNDREFGFSPRAINGSRILKSGNSIYKRSIFDVLL